MEFKDVHDRHCCKVHGCKYCDPNCTVEFGPYDGILCESCQNDRDSFKDWWATQPTTFGNEPDEITLTYETFKALQKKAFLAGKNGYDSSEFVPWD